MRLHLLVLLSALAGSAVASIPALPQADPAPVVAAERTFAAEGEKLGWVKAFKAWAAPDAVTFSPDAVNAQANLSKLDDKKAGPDLIWWPLWAGVARSGDLGFTTGPFKVGERPGGHYFTVWKRQPDGAWKWVFDGGPRVVVAGGPPAGTPPEVLENSGPGGGAMSEVETAEAELAAAAAASVPSAYRAVLATDARIAGLSPVIAKGPAWAAELNARPAAIGFKRLGGDISKAGDLAWTYGDASWESGGAAARGHYVRIWRRDGGGWRIVYDQILPAAKPKAS